VIRELLGCSSRFLHLYAISGRVVEEQLIAAPIVIVDASVGNGF
jgi:hypothetical protein